VDIETVSDIIVPGNNLDAVSESPPSVQGGLGGQQPSFSREARLPLSYDRGITALCSSMTSRNVPISLTSIYCVFELVMTADREK
jgi:hypothetical protein